jgi:hypothetical protein
MHPPRLKPPAHEELIEDKKNAYIYTNNMLENGLMYFYQVFQI